MDVAVAKEGGFTILQLMEQAGRGFSGGLRARFELCLRHFQGLRAGGVQACSRDLWSWAQWVRCISNGSLIEAMDLSPRAISPFLATVPRCTIRRRAETRRM